MKAAGAALCALLCACPSESSPTPPKSAQGKAAATKEIVALPEARRPSEFRGPFITRHAGRAAPDSLIAPSQRSAPGELLTLSDGGQIELDFGCGTRTQVLGPALVAVSARSDQGLLVRHGLLRVELPPGAVKPGPPCWLATPSFRMDWPRAARFVLRVHDDGRTQLAVVSGRVTLDLASPSNQGDSASPQAVEAGHLFEVDSPHHARPPRDSEGPATMEAALAKLAVKSDSRTAHAPVDLGMALRASLETTLARTSAALTRQNELDQQHRGLVAAGGAQAMALQRQIATQAADTFRARRSLDAALSRLEAARLTQTQALPPDPLQAGALEILR